MRIRFSFHHALTQEQIDRVQPILDSGGHRELVADQYNYWEYACDLVQLQRAVPELIPHIKLAEADIGVGALTALAEQMDRIEARLKLAGDPDNAFNQKVQVHVPGLGLFLINKIYVHRDTCTEEIQRELEEGWRIVAVCPQPNQRRPDYILGRYEP